VKPDLIPNADEELDFDIIEDFKELFDRVQIIFEDYE